MANDPYRLVGGPARHPRVPGVRRHRGGGELWVLVGTTADRAFCPGCGGRAAAKDRLEVTVRDLPFGGRPTCLVWSKRRWECEQGRVGSAPGQTSTRPCRPGRRSPRARWEACRAVGEDGRSVAGLARWLRVAWAKWPPWPVTARPWWRTGLRPGRAHRDDRHRRDGLPQGQAPPGDALCDRRGRPRRAEAHRPLAGQRRPRRAPLALPAGRGVGGRGDHRGLRPPRGLPLRALPHLAHVRQVAAPFHVGAERHSFWRRTGPAATLNTRRWRRRRTCWLPSQRR